jgi:hypothetical protein
MCDFLCKTCGDSGIIIHDDRSRTACPDCDRTELFQAIHEAVDGEYVHDMNRVIAFAVEKITKNSPALAPVAKYIAFMLCDQVAHTKRIMRKFEFPLRFVEQHNVAGNRAAAATRANAGLADVDEAVPF